MNHEQLKEYSAKEREIATSYIQTLEKNKRNSVVTKQRREETNKIQACSEIFKKTIPPECIGDLDVNK
jgi:hypothetical protein